MYLTRHPEVWYRLGYGEASPRSREENDRAPTCKPVTMLDSRVASSRHSTSCWIVRASSPSAPLVVPACDAHVEIVIDRAVERVHSQEQCRVLTRCARAYRGVERADHGLDLVDGARA